MVVEEALRLDAFAVGVAVGVVTDEVGVEDVGQLRRQGGDPAVGTDGGPALVGVLVPDAHEPIIPNSGRQLRGDGDAGNRRIEDEPGQEHEGVEHLVVTEDGRHRIRTAAAVDQGTE